jgi:hypothetical protein
MATCLRSSRRWAHSTSAPSQLAECDAEIQRAPTLLHAHDGTPAAGKRRSRSRNAPKFEVREHLFQLCGVDLRATIIGIRDAVTAVR